MRKLMLTIVFIHLLAGAAYSLTVPEAFEGYAAKFKFLGVNELLYDRSDIYLADPNAMKDYLAVLKDFRARHDKPQDLLPLLTAKNPKVRTLAIVALYLNENPRALPDIHKLVHDVEPTFDDPPVDQDRVRASGIGPPHEPKTVGAVAQAVIDFYLRAARARDEGFDVYWAKHENRDCCVSWFAVQMLRATRGTSPLPEGSVDRIHALRQAISAAPPESRSWILLQLAMDEYAQYGISHLVPDRELRTLCRGVTSATLRRMIASRYDGDTPGNFTFDDPDLRPADLRWFILEHAKDLLTADDAEVVLAAGNPVAASELRPAMAPTWLPAALDKQPRLFHAWQRAQIVAALWRISGPSQTKFIVDWFYTQVPDRGTHPSARGAFLESALENPRPELRDLLAAIITDNRFSQAGPESTRVLMQTINPWVPRPLATEEEIREAYHHGEFDRSFKLLQVWQAKLQQSVKDWKP